MVGYDGSVDVAEESGKILSRDAEYTSYSFEQAERQIPNFALRDFRSKEGGTPNPYLKAVNRLPDEKYADEIPVGVVSQTYGLVNHRDVLHRCHSGLEKSGIRTENMKIDVGLSTLGEWMNLRFLLPEEYDFVPKDGHPLKLRLEAFNSVDASSRFKLLLSWKRLICSNGMMIRETIAEFTDVHDSDIDLSPVHDVIRAGLKKIPAEKRRIEGMEGQAINRDHFESWIDDTLAKKWGVKLAARIFHICQTGKDAEFEDPFAKGSATQKPMKPLLVVPGAAASAENFYDVALAMSWTAGRVRDLARREKLLLSIDDRLKELAKGN